MNNNNVVGHDKIDMRGVSSHEEVFRFDYR